MSTQIRHLAIRAQSTGQLADFYKSAFGLREIRRRETKGGGEAVYLTDGYINLALLPARGEGEGLHHFGFQIESDEDEEAISSAAVEHGARSGLEERPQDNRYAETRMIDPIGIPIDVSRAGFGA
jgi:catechol 2,3-dioxygenase-like lactoylglutathione lyase family enzyme